MKKNDCVSEKIIRERKKEVTRYIVPSEKPQNHKNCFEFNCLAFADNIVLFV